MACVCELAVSLLPTYVPTRTCHGMSHVCELAAHLRTYVYLPARIFSNLLAHLPAPWSYIRYLYSTYLPARIFLLTYLHYLHLGPTYLYSTYL